MEGTKDIKNFTKFPSLSDDDLLLGSKTSLGGTDASITVANFKKQVVQDVKPSIVNGYWWVDNINTGVLATGRTPKFRKTSAGLEMKYEDQDDTAYIILIPMSDLAFTFDDLSPEQVEELKLKFSDLTDADKEALRGKAFTYDMFTPEQLADLRLTWDKLTPEQKNSLKGDRGYSAFEVWTQQEGNVGKTVDDYLAWLRQPATDAAKRADEKMSQISEAASIAIKAANDAATNANNAAENVQDGVDGKTPILESVSAISGETPSGSFSQVGVDDSGNPKYILNLTLPKGKDGQPAVFEAGTTTTLAPSAEASVEVVPNGETPNGNPKYILNFFIPRGETGLPGAGSGNVSAEGAGLIAGKKYFFVPDASDSTSGRFVEYVDGPESGIDADLLDGKQGSEYLLATDADRKFLPLTGGTVTGNMQVKGNLQINSSPESGNSWVQSLSQVNMFDDKKNVIGFLNYLDLFIIHFFDSNNIQKALRFENGSQIAYQYADSIYRIYHQGNQGAGSGLDADLLDGKQGSEYALKTEIPDTIPDAPADGKTYGRKNEAWAEIKDGVYVLDLDAIVGDSPSGPITQEQYNSVAEAYNKHSTKLKHEGLYMNCSILLLNDEYLLIISDTAPLFGYPGEGISLSYLFITINSSSYSAIDRSISFRGPNGAGLGTKFLSDNGEYLTPPTATSTTAGYMSSSDKQRLDSALVLKNVTTASTLSNLSIANYSIKVTLSAASALSFASTPAEGWECMIDIKNSSASNITQPLPNASDWQCDNTSITIAAGKIASISVRYIHGTYVVIAKGN